MGYKENHLVCQACGYDMHDRKGGDRCPECGTILDDRHAVPHADRKSRKAIIWLTISIVTVPFIGSLSIPFFGIGCLFSSQILRKTTYHRTPYHIMKRLKLISTLMWVYGALYLGMLLFYMLTGWSIRI